MTDEDRRSLAERVHAIGWYHSIDLGDGIVTPGRSENTVLTAEQLPALRGRSVLDIGAWDGYYSFLAERLGASRVVSLDHYAWGVDLVARFKYWSECTDAGVLPDHDRDLTEFWDPELPGRRGFDLAREALHSKVEPRLGDFATIDLASLGTFDVVLYLGVLYHVKEPLTVLERLRQVTTEVAVVETEAIHVENYDHATFLQFSAGAVGNDYGVWYIPTIRALEELCRAAGFSHVETVLGPPPPTETTESEPGRASRTRAQPERVASRVSAPSTNYRAVVHAWV